MSGQIFKNTSFTLLLMRHVCPVIVEYHYVILIDCNSLHHWHLINLKKDWFYILTSEFKFYLSSFF